VCEYERESRKMVIRMEDMGGHACGYVRVGGFLFTRSDQVL
jgi:hypothetical protein